MHLGHVLTIFIGHVSSLQVSKVTASGQVEKPTPFSLYLDEEAITLVMEDEPQNL